VKKILGILKTLVGWFNLRNIIIFVMPVSIAVLIVMLYNLSQTVDALSHSLIKRTTSKTETELHDFFDPVVSNLLIARDRGKAELFGEINSEVLNPYFIPFLKNSPQVSSMLIASSKGDEYMLLEEDSTWQNRITEDPAKNIPVTRYRWLYDEYLKGTMMEKWIKDGDSSNFPTGKPWYVEAITNSFNDQPAWTDPYTFKTTGDPGITASIKWDCAVDSIVTKVIAFDILLTDISKFTINLEVSPNGKAFIFNDAEMVIGLPGSDLFKNTDSLKAHVLKPLTDIHTPVVAEAVKEWKKNGRKDATPFYFNYDGESWWCGIKHFKLSPKKSFYIAVVVPEKDFLEEVNKTKTIVISGFILVIVLTLLVIRGYNQKRKANVLLEKQKREIEAQRDEISKRNEEIMQQKEEITAQRDEIETQRDEITIQRDLVMKQKDHIEEQKKEITDSITYAKRIQNAVLPTGEYANNILGEHFILFKPKDIVSGDFYWATEINDWLIFTVADCTGHGVPGAFMSMLGVSFLNEIVRKKEVTKASEILDHLRDSIIEALQQKGQSGEQKDGMDITLCVLDKKTKKLQFSGANNPLFIITGKDLSRFEKEGFSVSEPAENGVYAVEVKPDKQPVAIHIDMKPFTNHDIQLEKGECLYLLSDGYEDQFGGPNNKKFKIKNLRELFLKISELPMSEQKDILDETFETWRGENEQVDDVTVMGMRI